MTYNCSASLVLFHNDRFEIEHVIDCFFKSSENRILFIIDNSADDFFSFLSKVKNINYYKSPKNIGYGPAHNIALRNVVKNKISNYHIILNPDISFDDKVIDELIRFCQTNDQIGLISPKIYNEDGKQEYLCKLIPSPIDLVIRLLKLNFLKKRILNFQMRHLDYDKIIEAPYLSGSFMFLRAEVLNKIGYFDELFFMYPEDIDLTRRINEHYKTLYYPNVSIIHKHKKESYKKIKMLKIHIFNMIKYFNKWGWFFDKKRTVQNKKALNQLQI